MLRVYEETWSGAIGIAIEECSITQFAEECQLLGRRLLKYECVTAVDRQVNDVN